MTDYLGSSSQGDRTTLDWVYLEQFIEELN